MEEILIADSGATKTDWCVAKRRRNSLRFTVTVSVRFIRRRTKLPKKLKECASSIEQPFDRCCLFYGSGCIPEKKDVVGRAVRRFFAVETVEVYSDLIAAAHALCGRDGDSVFLAQEAIRVVGR